MMILVMVAFILLPIVFSQCTFNHRITKEVLELKRKLKEEQQ